MPTISELKTQNEANIKSKTAAGSITPVIDGDERAKVLDELRVRGILYAADTTELGTKRGDDTAWVLVPTVGMFTWVASGTANGTTIISAADSGVWVLVMASAAGAIAPDATPPGIVSLTAVDASTIRVVFTENTTGTLAGWSFKNNGSPLVPSGVTGSGTTTWDFATTGLVNTDVLLASYDAGTGDAQDAAGNALASFTDSAVTNSIPGVLPSEAILILQIGQSNAVGRAPASAPDEISAPSNAYEFKIDTGTLAHLEDPTGISGDYAQASVRSMNPQLGKRLVELTGKAVIIVPVARGNTAINTWITTTNIEYTNALSRWNDAVNYCTTNGITISGKYAHWLQGENDAAAAMAEDSYIDKFNTMVDLLIGNFSVDKVFATRIGYDDTGTVDANAETIMKAQKELNFSKDELIIGTYLPATFTEGDTAISGNRVHYTLKGQNLVGDAIAQSINTYRTTNKKVVLTEPVASLQDAVGYFDDIYNFRSLTPGVNNTDYNELWGRNNLTLLSGSPSFDAERGLVLPGTSCPMQAATVRTLLNSHDWTVEMTFRLDGVTQGMMIVGRSSGTYSEDWIWINGTNSINLKGNGVSTSATLTGANFNQLSNLVLVYTTADNTLKCYVNGALLATITTWAFTEIKLEKFFRGYTATPDIIPKGAMERIRIVKKALAVWEFDRSPNILTAPSFAYDFQLNGNLNEANDSVSALIYDKSTAAISTADYDADGLTFNGTTAKYLRLGQQKNLNADWTFEIRLKSATGTGTQVFASKGPRPADGAIAFYLDGTPHNKLTCVYGSNKNFTLPGGTDTTIFHTYKLAYNSTAQTLSLYLDGTLVNTMTSIAPTSFLLQDFGCCYQSAGPNASDFTGTIDYIKLKNSL